MTTPESSRGILKAGPAPLVVWTAWMAALIAALIFATGNAPVAPYWIDEWIHVPVVTGHRPLSLDWLLAFHFEHRIPLPKLVWFAVERMSGFDGRWGSALNVLILGASAAAVLLGLRRMRGRTLWTDAAIPMLFLHWGHWHNMTWPFQVAFMLHGLFVSFLVGILLNADGTPTAARALLFGAGLFLLPLCGPSTFPFVALLGGWWLRLALPERRRPAVAVSIGLTVAAFLLAGTYLLGTRPPPPHPPSSSVGMTLGTALQFLAAGLGSPGISNWPLSGAAALIALGGLLALLLPSVCRNPASPAGGLLAVLAAFLILAVVIGEARGGTASGAGFTVRYVSLATLFPVLAVAASELVAHEQRKAVLRTALFALAATCYLPNAFQAASSLDLRRESTERLLRDVRAGMPLRMLAVEHGFWCPLDATALEDGLKMLAEARMGVYRDVAPPAPASLDRDGAAMTALKDGRRAYELLPRARVRVPLPAGASGLRIEYGQACRATTDVRLRARLLREGAADETILSEQLPRSFRTLRRAELDVSVPGTGVLEVLLEPEPGQASPSQDPQVLLLVRISPASAR